MYIVVSVTKAELQEPGDTSTLYVWPAVRLTARQVDVSLRTAGLGLFDGTQAHLEIGALRAAAGSSLADTQFDAMIEFAIRRGWVTGDGRYVTAHLETGS